MSQQHDTGKEGEQIATEYLEKNGFIVLDRNWRFQRAEVDIIVKKGPFVVFVEVKTRSSNAFGEPESFVNLQKQKLMTKAANAYMQEQDVNLEARFDIISILYSSTKHQLKHLENAFYPQIG